MIDEGKHLSHFLSFSWLWMWFGTIGSGDYFIIETINILDWSSLCTLSDRVLTGRNSCGLCFCFLCSLILPALPASGEGEGRDVFLPTVKSCLWKILENVCCICTDDLQFYYVTWEIRHKLMKQTKGLFKSMEDFIRLQAQVLIPLGRGHLTFVHTTTVTF